jgi:hypothetical protein
MAVNNTKQITGVFALLSFRHIEVFLFCFFLFFGNLRNTLAEIGGPIRVWNLKHSKLDLCEFGVVEEAANQGGG